MNLRLHIIGCSALILSWKIDNLRTAYNGAWMLLLFRVEIGLYGFAWIQKPICGFVTCQMKLNASLNPISDFNCRPIQERQKITRISVGYDLDSHKFSSKISSLSAQWENNIIGHQDKNFQFHWTNYDSIKTFAMLELLQIDLNKSLLRFIMVMVLTPLSLFA